MAEEARRKFGYFNFENLPLDSNDNIWTELRSSPYSLEFEELSALKYARCSQPGHDLGARKRSQSEVVLENFDGPTKLSVLQYFVSKNDFENENRKKEEYLEKYLDVLGKQLTMSNILHQLQMERSQVFRLSAMFYKRGIIELQLLIFIGLHMSYFDGPVERMLCENGWDAPISFSSAMKHWLTCPKHLVAPFVHTHFEDGMVIINNVKKSEVEKAIENLYGLISDNSHFKGGDSLPVKIVRFTHDNDTLAIISFLDHYHIQYFVVDEKPVPIMSVENGKRKEHVTVNTQEKTAEKEEEEK